MIHLLLLLLQFEGDWQAAHIKLSTHLKRLMVRMLRHLLQVAPEFPSLPRSSTTPRRLLIAVGQLQDHQWQLVSALLLLVIARLDLV